MMPWDRVETPADIPDPCDAVRLRLLDDAQFGELLRSHLIPGKDRVGWQQLWVALSFNEDLAERTFDQLDAWLDLARRSTDPRVVKFVERCDEAWNRLTRIRDLDSRPTPDPRPGTTAHQFLMAILVHRHAVGEESTKVDRALWAAAGSALDRARRSGRNTKDWAIAPTYTSQLIDAVRAHRDLSGFGNAADQELWSILRD